VRFDHDVIDSIAATGLKLRLEPERTRIVIIDPDIACTRSAFLVAVDPLVQIGQAAARRHHEAIVKLEAHAYLQTAAQEASRPMHPQTYDHNYLFYRVIVVLTLAKP
jgi:hypothetical protein